MAIRPTAAGARLPAVNLTKVVPPIKAPIIRAAPTGAVIREAKVVIREAKAVIREAKAAIRAVLAEPAVTDPSPSPTIRTDPDLRDIRDQAATRDSVPIRGLPRAVAIRGSAPIKALLRAVTRAHGPIHQVRAVPIPADLDLRVPVHPVDTVPAILPRADPGEGLAIFPADLARAATEPGGLRAVLRRWRRGEPANANRVLVRRVSSSAGRTWSWRRNSS